MRPCVPRRMCLHTRLRLVQGLTDVRMRCLQEDESYEYGAYQDEIYPVTCQTTYVRQDIHMHHTILSYLSDKCCLTCVMHVFIVRLTRHVPGCTRVGV